MNSHNTLKQTKQDDVLAELYAVREQMAREVGNNADALFSSLMQRHLTDQKTYGKAGAIYLKLQK